MQVNGKIPLAQSIEETYIAGSPKPSGSSSRSLIQAGSQQATIEPQQIKTFVITYNAGLTLTKDKKSSEDESGVVFKKTSGDDEPSEAILKKADADVAPA